MSGTQNVTIEPNAPATPVDDPEIKEILDLGTGEIVGAKEFIASHRYDRLIEKRIELKARLKKKKPCHICPICHVAVYIVASPDKRFFFRHMIEDGSCIAKTRSDLSEDQIRARKYHGLRESAAHIRIKQLIERSLIADPSFLNESIQSERRWTSKDNPAEWRQPDIQAAMPDEHFAFEVQLTTTFLDVVVSRKLFYSQEGATLVWILGSFDPNYRRMTTDDLLFSNNSNVFVVNEETTLHSEEQKKFHLLCHFRRPSRDGDTLSDNWDEVLVPFDDLTRSTDRSQIFFFDYEREEQQLREQIKNECRQEFIAFWMDAMQPHFDRSPTNCKRWHSLQERLARHGVRLPDEPGSDYRFRTLIHGILSAIKGCPVGWQFSSLIQVAHRLADGHKPNLLAFGFALQSSNHQSILKKQDRTGKWDKKRKLAWRRIKAGDPDYIPDEDWRATIAFLFPDVGARMDKFFQDD